MSETGPMWLTRDDDVVAHLYFAAAEIGAATMELGALQVPGSLSFPNPEHHTFSFFTHGEVDLSESQVGAGDVVRLRYVQGSPPTRFCPKSRTSPISRRDADGEFDSRKRSNGMSADW